MFLELRQIKKSFGQGENRVEVLHGIDLKVEQGEFCVLLGPSGSGKSTLLNIIGGIDSADSGELLLDGQRLSQMKERRLTAYRRDHLGYVFQMYNLIPNLTVRENMLSPYQYILNMPVQAMDEGHKLENALTMLQFRKGVETDHKEGAEKFTAYTLKTLGDKVREEDIMVYGVEPDSRYVPIHCRAGEAYVSSAYADKYRLTAGDSITLKEPYEDTTYTLRVAGVVDYLGALSIFLEREQANERFDLGRGYFSGYFSDRPMEDLEERYVGSVIDLNALTKVSRQLDVSMGSMMYLVDGFAVVVYLVLLYLLSKLILERSALSISLTKILGYSNGEIARLYLLATSVMVVVSLLVTLPLVYRALLVIFRKMLMAEMSGWIPLVLDDSVFLTIFALGLGSYAVVAALEYRRICAIPMEEALKNVE